jgi:VIT1/CCC1 family predicted Fe2+/Mn2+ transporter
MAKLLIATLQSNFKLHFIMIFVYGILSVIFPIMSLFGPSLHDMYVTLCIVSCVLLLALLGLTPVKTDDPRPGTAQAMALSAGTLLAIYILIEPMRKMLIHSELSNPFALFRLTLPLLYFAHISIFAIRNYLQRGN